MTYENVVEAWDLHNRNRPKRLRRRFNEAEARAILADMKRDFAAVIGKPRIKFIVESGKERRLQVPHFRSVVAQLAVWNICGKYIENRVHTQSFSSRKGYGGHMAARKVERFVRTRRADSRYCLYFDVKKYYQHINPRILMSRIEAIFKDKKVLELFKVIIYSADEGLPIGYPFSHALANLYLAPLYFIMKSTRGITKIYVYMDNWTVFCRTKKPLHKALMTARGWLAGMGCTVKHDWQIYPVDKRPVRICGFAIGRRRTKLYRGIWRRTCHALDNYRKHATLKQFLSLMSRLGWLKAIHMEYHPIFKLKDGGYLWQ